MEPKVNYVAVGVFIVALGSVLVSVVLWLGKGNYGTTYDRYDVYMRESVSGLSVNSPVKYHGVEVGRIANIALHTSNPEEVSVSLDIVRGAPVKEDTRASLRTQGLTGFAIIDLTGGSPASPQLTAKAGEEFPVIQTTPSLLARLNETGGQLLSNLNQLTEDARQVMDEENRAVVKQIVTHLATLTEALAAQSERMNSGLADAAQTAENLAAVSQKVRGELPAILARMGSAASGLETMSQDAARTSAAVAAIVTRSQPTVEQTLTEGSHLIAELRQLTASLTRVVRHLEETPNALVAGRSAPAPGPGE